jgi:hypothetical protein
MTARDEAIDAMDEEQIAQLEYPLQPIVLGWMLDAIPAEVLARLAIERGGLQTIDTDIRGIGPLGLYRLVG